MPVEQHHELNRRAAGLDKAALVFVEGVGADLEDFARRPLREFQLAANAADRRRRWPKMSTG
ncbi:MAG TPA: hypothetical protein VF474_11515 [Phenylobacterium sp.]